MNGLNQVLEQDIVRFLEQRVDPKKDRKKLAREEEFTLFDLQKDYAKELHKALLQDNLHAARKVYEEFRTHYDAEVDTTVKQKKLFPILKELHTKIKKYMEDHKKEKNLEDELAEFEQQLPGDEKLDTKPPTPPPGATQETGEAPAPEQRETIDWQKKVDDLNNMIFEASNLLEDDLDAAKDYFHHIKALSDLIPVQYKDHELYAKMVDLGARIRSQEKAIKDQGAAAEQAEAKEAEQAAKREEAMKKELEAFQKRRAQEEQQAKEAEEAKAAEEEEKARAEEERQKQEEEARREEERQQRIAAAAQAREEHLRKNQAFKLEMKLRQGIKTIEDQLKMGLLPDATQGLRNLSHTLDTVDRTLLDPVVIEDLNSQVIALQAKLNAMHQEKEQGVMTEQAEEEVQASKVTIYQYHPESNKQLTMHELYTKGLYLFHEHQYDDAIRVFKEILRRKPNSLSAKIRIQEAQEAKKTGERYGW